jgi:hypothetical protein
LRKNSYYIPLIFKEIIVRERKKRVYQIFFEKIKQAQKIALISHINPDVDTL